MILVCTIILLTNINYDREDSNTLNHNYESDKDTVKNRSTSVDLDVDCKRKNEIRAALKGLTINEDEITPQNTQTMIDNESSDKVDELNNNVNKTPYVNNKAVSKTGNPVYDIL